MSQPPLSNSIPDHRWFALADILLVLAAGVLWYVRPALSGWPLILALLPWAVRLAFRRFPFKRTALDPLFLLFMMTAVVGVWASYDPARSLAKFWLVLDGVLLFYALVGQPRENLRLVAWGVGGFAAALSVYFFLTNDWQSEPAKIILLKRMGVAWMTIRPTLQAHILHPNVMAGMVAMTAPFLAAAGLQARGRKQVLAAGLAALGLVLALLAVWMSASRGVWLALLAACTVPVTWYFSGRVAERAGARHGWTFTAVLAAVVLLGVFAIAAYPGGAAGLLDRLPGPARSGSRLDLVRALTLLIEDFPFTGGGLDAFPGLYARYILSIPSYRLEHGHNFYLDAALEQGLVGLAAVLAILVFSAGRIVAGLRRGHELDPDRRLLAWAALVGLLVLGVHGLMDDVLYGSRGSLLLWVPSAVGLAATGLQPTPVRRTGARVWALPAAVVLAGLLLAGAFSQPLRAAWFANLGAVRMSRVELADFPTDRWADGSEAEELLPAARLFSRALAIDPQNTTAHYRQGLIAMQLREFELAVSHLEAARRLSPQHPGVSKSLAYALLWDDRLPDALPLLRRLPEAGRELENYIWYWRGLGRADLSQNARAALQSLAGP